LVLFCVLSSILWAQPPIEWCGGKPIRVSGMICVGHRADLVVLKKRKSHDYDGN